ncbi:MAG TPA: monovalent cation/H(+) antiporter subunit G [Deinococcales bacterium]|nr:monovalent cation/H(+) antiporter subunit G [Deinococcales bacterium]
MNPDFNAARDLPILVGSFFVLTAAIGVLRFPDLYTRLHASTKLVTLGSAGIFLGAYFEFREVDVAARIIAITLFQLLTTPVGAYTIARASYLRGLRPMLDAPDRDEWRALGSVVPEGEPAQAAPG